MDFHLDLFNVMYRRPSVDDGRDRQLSQSVGDMYLPGSHVVSQQQQQQQQQHQQQQQQNESMSASKPIIQQSKTSVLRQYRKPDFSQDKATTTNLQAQYQSPKPTDDFCTDYNKLTQPNYVSNPINDQTHQYYPSLNKSYAAESKTACPQYYGGYNGQVLTAGPKLVQNAYWAQTVDDDVHKNYLLQNKQNGVQYNWPALDGCYRQDKVQADARSGPQNFTMRNYPAASPFASQNVFVDPQSKTYPRYACSVPQKLDQKYKQPYPILEKRLINHDGYDLSYSRQIMPPRTSPSACRIIPPNYLSPGQQVVSPNYQKRPPANWALPIEYGNNAYLNRIGQVDPAMAQSIIGMHTAAAQYESGEMKDQIFFNHVKFAPYKNQLHYPELSAEHKPQPVPNGYYDQRIVENPNYAAKPKMQHPYGAPQDAQQAVYRSINYPRPTKPSENPPRNISPRRTFTENMTTYEIPHSLIHQQNEYCRRDVPQYEPYRQRAQNIVRNCPAPVPRMPPYQRYPVAQKPEAYRCDAQSANPQQPKSSKDCDTPKLNLKQYLECWKESEELISNLPDIVLSNNPNERSYESCSASDNSSDKVSYEEESAARPAPVLYVYEKQVLEPEMVGKYKHLTQIDHLPDNIIDKDCIGTGELEGALNLSLNRKTGHVAGSLPILDELVQNGKTAADDVVQNNNYQSVIVPNLQKAEIDKEINSFVQKVESEKKSAGSFLDMSLSPVQDLKENLDMLSEYVNSNTSYARDETENNYKPARPAHGCPGPIRTEDAEKSFPEPAVDCGASKTIENHVRGADDKNCKFIDNGHSIFAVDIDRPDEIVDVPEIIEPPRTADEPTSQVRRFIDGANVVRQSTVAEEPKIHAESIDECPAPTEAENVKSEKRVEADEEIDYDANESGENKTDSKCDSFLTIVDDLEIALRNLDGDKENENVLEYDDGVDEKEAEHVNRNLFPEDAGKPTVACDENECGEGATEMSEIIQDRKVCNENDERGEQDETKLNMKNFFENEAFAIRDGSFEENEAAESKDFSRTSTVPVETEDRKDATTEDFSSSDHESSDRGEIHNSTSSCLARVERPEDNVRRDRESDPFPERLEIHQNQQQLSCSAKNRTVSMITAASYEFLENERYFSRLENEGCRDSKNLEIFKTVTNCKNGNEETDGKKSAKKKKNEKVLRTVIKNTKPPKILLIKKDKLLNNPEMKEIESNEHLGEIFCENLFSDYVVKGAEEPHTDDLTNDDSMKYDEAAIILDDVESRVASETVDNIGRSEGVEMDVADVSPQTIEINDIFSENEESNVASRNIDEKTDEETNVPSENNNTLTDISPENTKSECCEFGRNAAASKGSGDRKKTHKSNKKIGKKNKRFDVKRRKQLRLIKLRKLRRRRESFVANKRESPDDNEFFRNEENLKYMNPENPENDRSEPQVLNESTENDFGDPNLRKFNCKDPARNIDESKHAKRTLSDEIPLMIPKRRSVDYQLDNVPCSTYLFSEDEPSLTDGMLSTLLIRRKPTERKPQVIPFDEIERGVQEAMKKNIIESNNKFAKEIVDEIVTATFRKSATDEKLDETCETNRRFYCAADARPSERNCSTPKRIEDETSLKNDVFNFDQDEEGSREECIHLDASPEAIENDPSDEKLISSSRSILKITLSDSDLASASPDTSKINAVTFPGPEILLVPEMIQEISFETLHEISDLSDDREMIFSNEIESDRATDTIANDLSSGEPERDFISNELSSRLISDSIAIFASESNDNNNDEIVSISLIGESSDVQPTQPQDADAKRDYFDVSDILEISDLDIGGIETVETTEEELSTTVEDDNDSIGKSRGCERLNDGKCENHTKDEESTNETNNRRCNVEEENKRGSGDNLKRDDEKSDKRRKDDKEREKPKKDKGRSDKDHKKCSKLNEAKNKKRKTDESDDEHKSTDKQNKFKRIKYSSETEDESNANRSFEIKYRSSSESEEDKNKQEITQRNETKVASPDKVKRISLDSYRKRMENESKTSSKINPARFSPAVGKRDQRGTELHPADAQPEAANKDRRRKTDAEMQILREAKERMERDRHVQRIRWAGRNVDDNDAGIDVEKDSGIKSSCDKKITCSLLKECNGNEFALDGQSKVTEIEIIEYVKQQIDEDEIAGDKIVAKEEIKKMNEDNADKKHKCENKRRMRRTDEEKRKKKNERGINADSVEDDLENIKNRYKKKTAETGKRENPKQNTTESTSGTRENESKDPLRKIKESLQKYINSFSKQKNTDGGRSDKSFSVEDGKHVEKSSRETSRLLKNHAGRDARKETERNLYVSMEAVPTKFKIIQKISDASHRDINSKNDLKKRKRSDADPTGHKHKEKRRKRWHEANRNCTDGRAISSDTAKRKSIEVPHDEPSKEPRSDANEESERGKSSEATASRDNKVCESVQKADDCKGTRKRKKFKEFDHLVTFKCEEQEKKVDKLVILKKYIRRDSAASDGSKGGEYSKPKNDNSAKDDDVSRKKKRKRFRNLYGSEDEDDADADDDDNDKTTGSMKVQISLQALQDKPETDYNVSMKSGDNRIPKVIIKKNGSGYSIGVMKDARLSFWKPSVVLRRVPKDERVPYDHYR